MVPEIEVFPQPPLPTIATFIVETTLPRGGEMQVTARDVEASASWV